MITGAYLAGQSSPSQAVCHGDYADGVTAQCSILLPPTETGLRRQKGSISTATLNMSRYTSSHHTTL